MHESEAHLEWSVRSGMFGLLRQSHISPNVFRCVSKQNGTTLDIGFLDKEKKTSVEWGEAQEAINLSFLIVEYCWDGPYSVNPND